jgi:hypothetical protein
MLKENPIIAGLDPKAVCRHTRSTPLNMKGQPYVTLNLKGELHGKAYISAERFLVRKYPNNSGSTN